MMPQWSRLGGNFDNNVVRALHKRLQQEHSVLALNFRGVGGSDGRTSFTGAGEREDALDACRYAAESLGAKRIATVGYSFGALVGCSVINEGSNVVASCGVSYPFGVSRWLSLWNTSALQEPLNGPQPKLQVIGTQDNFTSVATWEARVAQFPNTETRVFDGVDHFWGSTSELNELCETIVPWCRQVLGESEGTTTH
mmetsp:Transcript_72887/g.171389  ORF Transcript_72887/g.171389 Transcript_72887/m.171389 type:complete len:197 (+) Transcript_72887:40-630(+)